MSSNPMLDFLNQKPAVETTEGTNFIPPIPAPVLQLNFPPIPAPVVTEKVETAVEEAEEVPTLLEIPKMDAPPKLEMPPIPVLGVPPGLQGVTPIIPSAFTTGTNPFKSNNSKYEIILPANPTKRQVELKNSGVRPEDMPQEDLREIYYLLEGKMGSHIYRASSINHIAVKKELPTKEDREESEWMFMGSAIHEAMETQGESLKKLFHFGGLGEEPAKPDSSLSKDHTEMMREMIINKLSSIEAYIKVKDNLTTKGISPEWLKEDYEFPCITERKRLEKVYEALVLRADDLLAGTLEDLSDEEKELDAKKLSKKLADDVKAAEKELKAVKDSEELKAVTKVSRAALTEYEKFKEDMPVFEKYLQEMETFEVRRNQVREKAKAAGGIVLDDLAFTTTKGFRIYETIAKVYGALANNKESYDIYHPYRVSQNKFDCFSEYVVLYDYTLPNGKQVPFMSMVDRYIIDHTAKVAWVIDLKTYGKQGNFIHTNYKDHAYWRSMAVYYEAIRIDLERRGLSGYTIVCSLLPISIVSLEIGVYGIPLLNLSSQEIQMGTNGGMMKFQGSVFNDRKEVCTAMSEKLIQHLMDTDQITSNSPEFHVRGWKQIVNDFEMRRVPTMANFPQ